MRPSQVLEVRGWWPGPSGPALGDTQEVGPRGEVCIASAVRIAVENGWRERPRLLGDMSPPPRDIAAAIATELNRLKQILDVGSEEGSLAWWNDAPGRTVDEVRDALRAYEQASMYAHGLKTGGALEAAVAALLEGHRPVRWCPDCGRDTTPGGHCYTTTGCLKCGDPWPCEIVSALCEFPACSACGCPSHAHEMVFSGTRGVQYVGPRHCFQHACPEFVPVASPTGEGARGMTARYQVDWPDGMTTYYDDEEAARRAMDAVPGGVLYDTEPAPDPARRPPELRVRAVAAVRTALDYRPENDPSGKEAGAIDAAVDAVLPLITDATAEQIAGWIEKARDAQPGPGLDVIPVDQLLRAIRSGAWKKQP